MSDKLEPNDLAMVIKSVTGKTTGKIVTCIQVIGTDPKFGIIWLVQSPHKNLETYIDGAIGNQVHVPQDWLKKIPKDPLPDEETGDQIYNMKIKEEAL